MEKDRSKNSSIVACVFISTEPLLSSKKGIYIQPQILKHAAEMDSGVILHISGSIKIASAIQKIDREDLQGHRQHDDRISLLLFFWKIRKIGYKIRK
jgi:hypothetical protein